MNPEEDLAKGLPPHEWIRGHYHCKSCQGEIECWSSFPFQPNCGVSRIGGCKSCRTIMVEHENGTPEWFVSFTGNQPKVDR